MVSFNMYVNEQLLMKNKTHIRFFTREEFEKFKSKLKTLENKKGESSTVFFYKDNAFKIYNKEPILSNEDGILLFDGKDVIKNLFNLINIKNDDAASIDEAYICDNFLVGYKSKRIKVFDRMKDINSNNFDITLKDLKSSWQNALMLAEFYASKKIVMYDLNEGNSFISNGKFKICDLDFFLEEPFNNQVLYQNYNIVNTFFMHFIERFLVLQNYKCRKDAYLVNTNMYVDDAIEDLLLTSSYSCKTLKQVSENI